MRPLTLGLLAGLCAVAAPPPELARIRANMAAYEARLPDFVCHEKITSRRTADADGKLEKETVVESSFTGRQKKTGFVEERQVDRFNGTPWGNKPMPGGFFRVGGAFSSIVLTIFGKKGEGNFEYSAIPDSPDGLTGISFRSTTNKLRIKGKGPVPRSYQETGSAWFDATSLEIVRLETRIIAGPNEEIPVTIRYEPVRIGTETFRMPVGVTASAHRVVSGRAETARYEAVYTGYRKFGTSTSIEFQDPQ